jgi:chorismate--pyruvate lyase
LPRSGLRGGWNGITRLGARPLGEALFNDHRIKRESLAYLRLSPHHALFHAARPHHALSAPARGTPAGTPLLRSDPSAVQPMWARRSVFSLNGHPLLVTEVFLPGIEQL